MAYTLYKASGAPVTVPDNALDSDFYNPTGGGSAAGLGIRLVGRNTLDYGTAIAQNFLQMTENFATAMQGQLWFNTTNSTLYVRSTANTSGGIANWARVATTTSSTGTIPVVYTTPTLTANPGDMQVIGSVISIWANGAWKQVFPAVYS
jgi:hypothetical protein